MKTALIFLAALAAFMLGVTTAPIATATPGHQCFTAANCSHCEACVAFDPHAKVGNCTPIVGCK